MPLTYDYLIVGSGFAGATLAERIASQLNASVVIVEKRDHIGGLAYDYVDINGILVGKYGAHIFHTNNEIVWKYVNRFAEFNNYVHRVDAFYQGRFFALPLNLDTINDFFGTRMSAAELPMFLDTIREPIPYPKNAEEAVISRVGWALYEAFYRNYTEKQWGMDPRDLDASVTMRLPIRMNNDKRYFADQWQGVPKEGFAGLFQRMLANRNIHLLLNTEFKEALKGIRFNKLIYTGPIDAYFDYALGKLPYRSIDFRFETINREYFQQRAIINYPNDHEYTRCVEFKRLYQQKGVQTTVSREYPCWNDEEPYYPVSSPKNREMYRRYRELADSTPNTLFCGRLGTYEYCNMDQCIAQALTLFETVISRS